MKIYCILCDAAHFPMPVISSVAKKKNATFLSQVSNSWTLSSLAPLFTGKLTSDIIDHGLGWRSITKESVIENKQPWYNDVIMNEMLKKDWDVHYHNNTYAYQLLYGDPRIKQTSTTCSEGEVEKAGAWSEKRIVDLMFGTDEKSNEFNNKEFNFIKQMQEEAPTKNKFYFIKYHHLHTAIGKKLNIEEANQKIFDLIDAWDFNEPDSLFVFFADHGNYRLIDPYCTPPHAWLTWALVKDNTEDKKINKKLISIRDLYTLFADKVGVGYDKIEDIENIFSQQNRERVFFMEDGRSVIDKSCSTTACAIKAIEWDDKEYPSKFLQVSYHKPQNQFIMFLYDAPAQKLEICENVDMGLKRKLINRFSWINPWIKEYKSET